MRRPLQLLAMIRIYIHKVYAIKLQSVKLSADVLEAAHEPLTFHEIHERSRCILSR